MVYCYLRVSTEGQDLEKFKPAVLEHANKNDLIVKKWIEEKISSKVSYKKRLLNKLIEGLNEGDIILTPELSRIARSVPELWDIIEDIRKKKAQVHIIKENMIIKNDNSPMENMQINMLGAIAQFERDLIGMRTKEALKVKKAMGVILGRPEGKGAFIDSLNIETKQYIKSMFETGLSIKRITKSVNAMTEQNRPVSKKTGKKIELSPLTVRAWLEKEGMRERDIRKTRKKAIKKKA